MARKQPELPGMEEREIDALVQQAEKYRETRDERMRLSKIENEQKQNLILLMQKYKKASYNYRGIFISLTSEIGVKVRTKDDEQDDSRAAVRNTDEQIAVLKKKSKTTPDPSTEESAENVEKFFNNEEANADVAELIKNNFTAMQCDECKAIDGAHSIDCSKASGLTRADYLAYAKFTGVKSANSWARKWQLSHEKDGMIKAWLAEGKEAATKRIKNKKLAPKAAPQKQQQSRRRR